MLLSIVPVLAPKARMNFCGTRYTPHSAVRVLRGNAKRQQNSERGLGFTPDTTLTSKPALHPTHYVEVLPIARTWLVSSNSHLDSGVQRSAGPERQEDTRSVAIRIRSQSSRTIPTSYSPRLVIGQLRPQHMQVQVCQVGLH